MFVIMTVIVTIPSTIIYNLEGRVDEWETDNDKNSPSSLFSLGNFGKDSKHYETLELNMIILLNSLMIFLFYISFLLLRNHQSRVIKKVDEDNLTPGDFAIMVSNIPKEKTEKDLKAWLQTHLYNAEIMNINFAYDIRSVISKIRKTDKIKAILADPKKSQSKFYFYSNPYYFITLYNRS